MKKPRLFIVEDETITSDHLRRLLAKLGYEIAGLAANGTSALEGIAETLPDLILADIGLEGEIDGIEVAARVHKTWRIPTVFLTAYTDPETLSRAKVTEPYGYIVKPFAAHELHATIEIALYEESQRAARRDEATLTAQTLVRTKEELSAVTARLLNVHDNQQAEIARDLHDDLGQRVAALGMNLEMLWQKLPSETRGLHQPEFDKVLGQTNELQGSIRNISHRLHPSELDHLGLVVAVRQLADDFQRAQGAPIRFSTRNVPESLGRQVAVAFYRIAQEALTNARKYAGATELNIALTGSTNVLKMSIRDNGKGFDPQRQFRRRGLGLISMVERAEAVGGQVEIYSTLNEGTRILVTAPLDFRPEEASSENEKRLGDRADVRP